MRLTLDYPPIWLLGFAVAARGLAAISWRGPGWLSGPGWALIALALALTLAAVLKMRQHRTTLDPHGKSSALVTDGIFARTRNPIYLADLLLLAGLILIWRAPLALILLPGFAAVIAARFIAPEEARLQAAFPQAFRAYRARTRRWL